MRVDRFKDCRDRIEIRLMEVFQHKITDVRSYGSQERATTLRCLREDDPRAKQTSQSTLGIAQVMEHLKLAILCPQAKESLQISLKALR